ncbi:MAG: hypothetical protein IPJ09_05915 [Saprospiraceae bacterium]|nr:hypothetical protein [Saprospiraceae bacterium]
MVDNECISINFKNRRKMIILLSIYWGTNYTHAQVNQQLAQEYFKEAQALCEKDGGKLWGKSICGPMVIYDRQTKTIATSKPAPDAPHPQLLGLLNAPIQWGGETWIAYMWSDIVNRKPRERKELFLHEMFHGVQPQLKLGAAANTPEHLDAKDGRYWMRLEWKALEQALRKSGKQRKAALSDILAFRQARRTIFAANIEDERGQEITEGLAAYTGTKLAAENIIEAKQSAIDLLTGAENTANEASLVRTFAYISGPAYCILLDEIAPNWRKSLKNTDDFGFLLSQALKLKPSTDVHIAALKYAGNDILLAEEKREKARRDRLHELQKIFIDGSILIFPGGNHSFDSRGAVSIKGEGTVYYGPFRASGPWGKLEAEKGVLVATDGSTRRVAVPVKKDELTYTGDGWTLKINEGWQVKEGEKNGSFELVKK